MRSLPLPLLTTCTAIFLVINCKAIQLTYTQQSATLPSAQKQQMGAYCNVTNKIWLFGGVTTPQAVWSYNLKTDQLQTHPDAASSFQTYVFVAPIKDGVMYWNPSSTTTLAQFLTQSVSYDYNSLPSHPNGYSDFKITISPDADRNILFLLGGDGTKELHIFDLDAFIANGSVNWYQGNAFSLGATQPMITESYMYKLGDAGIEYLDISGTINDIISRQWQVFTKDLTHRTNVFALVQNSYMDHLQIWQVGGYDVYALNNVHILDVDNGYNLTVGPTPHTWFEAVLVYIHHLDVLYVLGGHTDDFGPSNRIYKLEYWQTTDDPTASPSIPPTQSPSSPTQPTTASPSIPPTQSTSSPTPTPTNTLCCDCVTPTTGVAGCAQDLNCQNNQICTFDTYCCDSQWDLQCANHAMAICSQLSSNPSAAPTASTANPTANPSVNPTAGPTQPSWHPSVSPTESTQTPSELPTDSTLTPSAALTESTQNPSVSPTDSTSMPSVSPTETSSNPSRLSTSSPSGPPTESPHESGKVDDDEQGTDDQGEDELSGDADTAESAESAGTLSLVLIILGCVLSICIVVIFVVFMARKLKRRREGAVKQTEVEMNSPSTNSNGGTRGMEAVVHRNLHIDSVSNVMSDTDVDVDIVARIDQTHGKDEEYAAVEKREDVETPRYVADDHDIVRQVDATHGADGDADADILEHVDRTHGAGLEGGEGNAMQGEDRFIIQDENENTTRK